MDEKKLCRAMRAAAGAALGGAPVLLVSHLAFAYADASSDRFTGELNDGRTLVVEVRDVDYNDVQVFVRDEKGEVAFLPDGKYELKDGFAFRVEQNRLSFDIYDEPGYRAYHAWREIVANPNPLTSLPDPETVVDYVRYLAPDGRSYYAVQRKGSAAYEAYVVEKERLVRLTSGEYPLPETHAVAGVKEGYFVEESVAALLLAAYESKGVPR